MISPSTDKDQNHVHGNMHSESRTSPIPSTPRSKMTRKPSFSIFPLTPPQSSHSTNQPQPYTPPQSPIFSDPRTSTLTPASTPPRSMASPLPVTAPIQIPRQILRFPSNLSDSSLPQYYNIKSNDTTCFINNDLLHVIALLVQGIEVAEVRFYHQALNLADESLASATQHELWDLAAKCHLYRTYCFMNLKRWKDARQAVTRAASIRAWGDHIEAVTRGIEWGEYEEEMTRRGLSPRDKFEEGREEPLEWFVQF